AYMYWKETGDLEVWKGIAQDSIVMNLDDMACVGCVDNLLLSSTIGRNKNLITGDVISVLINATAAFAENMAQFGVHIHLAGGETADVGDIVRTIDVGYTAFGRLPRKDLIVNNVQPGDVIVGWSSSGQASYETAYNGGMGSNGLTSARHDVFAKEYADKYPDTYDPNTPRELIYIGKQRLTDTLLINNVEIPVGKLVLSPTRTYLPPLKKLLATHRSKIHGLIHCTGGGQTKVGKFIEGVRVIKDNLFEVPPLFDLIHREAATEWREMYQVFNMGHRLEVYLPEAEAAAAIEAAKAFNIDAQIVGRVEKADAASVVVDSPFGTFEYTE
ncbi:MAG: phosphoribosylformylglycinamidine cyclo-ligase, partial [Phaeodactylibacter sp.]|nr:phosphoribosylformylglycinamidine cyclo-ligase [Phaeodactylibacter sp.]